MAGKRSEGLLVEAQPLRAAEVICRRLVDGVHIANGALLLAADTAWAEAINAVLVQERREDQRAAPRGEYLRIGPS